MAEVEQFSEPKDLFDEIVRAMLREDRGHSLRSALEKLKPWLWAIREARPFQIETVTMPRNSFLDCLNDADLLNHVTMKPWEQVTDDMRVRHAHRTLEEWAEEASEHLALEEIRARDGQTAIVAFLCPDYGPPTIVNVLGAWRTQDDFWGEYLERHIDTEFPPSEDEILQLWDHLEP